MSKSYLFRIDSAKDNDAFFATLQPTMSQVYAGVDFRIGESGWIPDLIRIILDETDNQYLVTIIELEATRSEALRECLKSQKVLPHYVILSRGAAKNL